MTQLAEAYFHLRPYKAFGEDIERHGREISSIAASAAAGLFRPDCEIEVKLEIGSLRGRAKVLGTLGLVLIGGSYTAMVNYKSFREGVGLAVQDARTFGGIVVEGSLSALHAHPKQVFRTERRAKTPGRVLKLLRRREWLRDHRSEIPADALAQEVRAISSLERDILTDLSPQEQKAFEKLIHDDDGPTPLAEDLPPAAIDDKYRGNGGYLTMAPLLFPYEETPSTPPIDYYARFKLSEWAEQHGLEVRTQESPSRDRSRDYPESDD